jgi:hypothetical protein
VTHAHEGVSSERAVAASPLDGALARVRRIDSRVDVGVGNTVEGWGSTCNGNPCGTPPPICEKNLPKRERASHVRKGP